jgi:hypothetical protein
MWQKILGGSADDYALSILQTLDGGYVAGGFSISADGNVSGNHGMADYWLVKLDDTGHIVWQKTYGGSLDDILMSIIQTSDSGYMLCGYTNSSDGDVTANYGNYDVWIIKVSKTGAIIWQKNYGGSGTDIVSNIERAPDNGFVIAATSASLDHDVKGIHDIGGTSDLWIFKIDPSGNLLWQKCMGGSSDDRAAHVVTTNDGGYIVTGTVESSDSDILGYHGGYGDIWIVKLNDDVSGVQPIVSELPHLIKVYPTVTDGIVHIAAPESCGIIRIKAWNTIGQEIPVMSRSFGNDLQVSFDNTPQGIYFLNITADATTENFRIIYRR